MFDQGTVIDPSSSASAPIPSSAIAQRAPEPQWSTQARAGVCQNERQSFHASIYRAEECVCHIFLTGLPPDEAAGFVALGIRAEAWIAEFKARENGGASNRGAAADSEPDPAAVNWKWTFCKEWLRLGGGVTDQAQLGEWASLLYDAHSQNDAREVARDELASAAS
jgi:hypothetical protein